MAILGFITLAIILVCGFIHAPRDWKATKPILSSYVVVLISITLYIFVPSILTLTSGSYTWAAGYYSEATLASAIWLSVLALVAFLYGNALLRRRGSIPSDEIEAKTAATVDAHSRSRLTDMLLFAMLGLGLALKIWLIVKTGGISDSIARMSGYAKEFSGIDNFDASAIQLRTISGIADGAATWGMLRALRERYQEKTWLVILLVTLSLSYITIAKRLILVLPILCVVVGLHVYRRSITTRVLPIVLAFTIGLGFITIIVRVFLPGFIGGYDMDLNSVEYANGSVLQFYLYSLEFASLEMISVGMLARQNILDLFGGVWDATYLTNIQPLFYSVPRALWPSKPAKISDLSYGISAELGVSPFQDPTVGFASTIIGTSYILAGIVGVMVAMFALGLVTARIDRRLMRRDWTDMSVILYALALVIAFHLFRQGSLGWTFIVAIVQQYGAIAALLVLAITSKTARGAPRSSTKQMAKR